LFLVKKIVKSIFTWMIASLIIVLIILMPRDVEYDATDSGVYQGAQYVYSVEKHFQALKQFFIFVKNNPSLGDFNQYQTVSEVLAISLQKSSMIMIPALIFGFILGLLKGFGDYRLSSGKLNLVGKGSTWFFLSIPDFFIVISIQLGLMYLYDKGLFFYVDVFGSDKPDNIIMGIIYLMIYPIFYIAKIVSISFEAEERKDYIRTAKSKGTSYNRILYKHVLWNCWVTILTNLSTISLFVLSNLFIVEKFMGYKGAGSYFFNVITPGAMVFIGSDRSLGLPNLAIALTLCFTFFILIIHLISHIAIYHFDKNHTEEST
jgi:oligopeptide transport system permease protein